MSYFVDESSPRMTHHWPTCSCVAWARSCTVGQEEIQLQVGPAQADQQTGHTWSHTLLSHSQFGWLLLHKYSPTSWPAYAIVSTGMQRVSNSHVDMTPPLDAGTPRHMNMPTLSHLHCKLQFASTRSSGQTYEYQMIHKAGEDKGPYLLKYVMTRATCVCCNMISDTHT